MFTRAQNFNNYYYASYYVLVQTNTEHLASFRCTYFQLLVLIPNRGKLANPGTGQSLNIFKRKMQKYFPRKRDLSVEHARAIYYITFVHANCSFVIVLMGFVAISLCSEVVVKAA